MGTQLSKTNRVMRILGRVMAYSGWILPRFQELNPYGRMALVKAFQEDGLTPQEAVVLLREAAEFLEEVSWYWELGGPEQLETHLLLSKEPPPDS